MDVCAPLPLAQLVHTHTEAWREPVVTPGVRCDQHSHHITGGFSGTFISASEIHSISIQKHVSCYSWLQLPFDLGFIDVSAVSVTTGISSVLTVLPAAAVVSLLFRLRKLELAQSGVHPSKGKEAGKDCFEGEV